MIKSFVYKSPQVILQLYKSLVRPHLEYSVQVWWPHLQKDKVIRKSSASYDKNDTRSQVHTVYEDRLAKLGLLTLQQRQLRGDLIKVLKIINGFDNTDFQNRFQSAHSGRGHSYKSFKRRLCT